MVSSILTNSVIRYTCHVNICFTKIGLIGLKKILLNKTNYYLNVNLRFQIKVCNGCHNLIQKDMSFNDVAIVSFKWDDYRTHFWCISKDEAIYITKNSGLHKKVNICNNMYIKKLLLS